ncbi:hypothetical protein BGZ94_006837 [Podila epigama]|nr:hypothetical protein BGZ94_006837 [Podila epigama]
MAFSSLLSDHEQKAFSQFVSNLAQEENARIQQLRSDQHQQHQQHHITHNHNHNYNLHHHQEQPLQLQQQYYPQHHHPDQTHVRPQRSPNHNHQPHHTHQQDHQRPFEPLSMSVQEGQRQTQVQGQAQAQAQAQGHGHAQEQAQAHPYTQQTLILPSQNTPVLGPSLPVMTLPLPLPTDTHSLELALDQHQRDWIQQLSSDPLLAPGGNIDPHAMSQAILQNPELMAQANAITQAMVIARQQQQRLQQEQEQHQQQQQLHDHAHQHLHRQSHNHNRQEHVNIIGPYQQHFDPTLKQEPSSPTFTLASQTGFVQRHPTNTNGSRSKSPPSVPSQKGYHSSSSSLSTSPTVPHDFHPYPSISHFSNTSEDKHQYQNEYRLGDGPGDGPRTPTTKMTRRKGSSASSSISNNSPLASGIPPTFMPRSNSDGYHSTGITSTMVASTTTTPLTLVTKSSTKNRHELLTDAEKKANHIASEQKRRQNIRVGFDSLVDIVPSLNDCHRSEALILQKSVDYIQRLLLQKNQLKNKVRNLQVNLGEPIDDEDSGTEMEVK